jgi:diketogulonate reductase-like aldo/keto reductase
MVNLGTGSGQKGDVVNATILWIEAGGRGFDTAYDYLDQREIAQGLKASDVNTSDVFITTKVPCGSYEEAAQHVDDNLKELAVKATDLLLIHSDKPFSPPFDCNISETWRALEDARKAGKTRAIGVSHFSAQEMASLSSKPSVNQCSLSVMHHDDSTIKYCKDNGIVYQSFSPLCGGSNGSSCVYGNVLKVPEVISIANAHSVSPAQVALKWIVQQGLPLTTASWREDYMREDLDLWSWGDLTSVEMTALSNVEKNTKTTASTSTASCPTVEIANGIHMPLVSLGHPDGNATINETLALELWLGPTVNGTGIDTAMIYQNQNQVGTAMRASGRPRESMFLVTKIPNVLPRKAMVEYVHQDIAQLGGFTPDVVLIHAPCKSGSRSRECVHATSEEIAEAWLGMEDVVALGLSRAIGVSNFAVKDLQPILDLNGTVPCLNQCEMYVGNHDDDTIAYCEQNGITYEAYSPLGRGSLNVQDARIQAIAKVHERSVYQVCLRWITQQNIPMALSTTKLAHDLSDLSSCNFDLTDEEMKTLSGI